MTINWNKIILGGALLASLVIGVQSVSPAVCVAIRDEALAKCSMIGWYPAEMVCQGLAWGAYWTCMGVN